MTKENISISLWAVIAFFVIIVAFGIYVFSNNSKGPLDGKKVINMNITCEQAEEGARAFIQLYHLENNYTTTQVIAAECRTTCEDEGTTFYDWKCTSDHQFLCYCNTK